jgi:hypothetical protein
VEADGTELALLSYTPQDQVVRADLRDHGSLDTRLEPCLRPFPEDDAAGAPRRDILSLPGVEAVSKPDGASLRVRGLEFAEVSGNNLLFGIGERVPAREHRLSEIRNLAAPLEWLRSPSARDREHPLYRRFPEA